MIESITGRAAAGEDLSADQMQQAIGAIMQGDVDEGLIAALLTALANKGETVDEIVGAARAMRQHMTPIRTSRQGLLDTCGTGGVSSRVFNISTSAAIVAAAAGVPVAKHGNRSVTSRSGSADVLEHLGVNIDATPEQIQRCLDEVGLCFCFARSLHPAMKNVAPVRAKLGIRTIFNVLGPLSNPAGAPFQLLGTGLPELRPKLAAALSQLDSQRAVVVTGQDGMGEVTLAGLTDVTVAEAGEVKQLQWSPADFGLSESSLTPLEVDDAAGSAELIRRVLAGEAGPARDIVVLNAAAALWAAGSGDSTTACAARAAAAIDSGAAREKLEQLASVSQTG